MEENGHKYLIAILIGSIFISFLAVYIFTRNALIPGLNFLNTGQIGDTIGGITAPIIGLIGFAIVYYSFAEQYKANQIQIKSLKQQEIDRELTEEYNLIETLLTNLDQKIELFEYIEKKDPVEGNSLIREVERASGKGISKVFVTYKGATALNKFCMYLIKNALSNLKTELFHLSVIDFLPDYYYIILYSKQLKEKVIHCKLDLKRKTILSERFELIYKSKISTNLSILLDKYKSTNNKNELLEELLSAQTILDDPNLRVDNPLF